jgi:hypothetical protein
VSDIDAGKCAVTVRAIWAAEERLFSFWPARDCFERMVLLHQLRLEIDDDLEASHGDANAIKLVQHAG